jgi:hypothetical protein
MSPDFDGLCKVFLRFNDSQRVGVEDMQTNRRYISLPLVGKGHSRENVGTAVKCADSRQKNVRNAKESCTVVTIMATVRAIPIMMAQIRRAIFAA